MTRSDSNRRILVVEDDEGFRELLFEELTDADLVVDVASSIAEAVDAVERNRPALVLCDLQLPNGTGLDLFEHLHAGDLLRPAFVLITAFGSISQAVEALKRGVDDFLTKPVDFDELNLRIERLLEVQRLRDEVSSYRESHAPPDFHQMVGQSRVMEELYARINRIAVSDEPVIIAGESGTGKELTARAIHAESPRSEGPFVPVNCAGIPASLVESEFFGHQSGAFTGAEQSRSGLFQEAENGTILLDEFSELPMPLQAKLLRVLQQEEVRPVGSDQPRSIDVRVIAATNRDLDELVDGHVREDLYYRLATFTLEVPPLRERGDDIARLASHFLLHSDASARGHIEGMTERALDCLTGYEFPGNVRELQNIVERAAVFCEGGMIGVDDLPRECRNHNTRSASDEALAGAPDSSTLNVESDRSSFVSMDELKRRYARHVLQQTEGNKRRAANILDIGRRTLYRYLDAQ